LVLSGPPLAANDLDFATPLDYMRINKLNPGPSGEDTELAANLAMSDQLFRA
jgi:hypothetical protein